METVCRIAMFSWVLATSKKEKYRLDYGTVIYFNIGLLRIVLAISVVPNFLFPFKPYQLHCLAKETVSSRRMIWRIISPGLFPPIDSSSLIYKQMARVTIWCWYNWIDMCSTRTTLLLKSESVTIFLSNALKFCISSNGQPKSVNFLARWARMSFFPLF